MATGGDSRVRLGLSISNPHPSLLLKKKKKETQVGQKWNVPICNVLYHARK